MDERVRDSYERMLGSEVPRAVEDLHERTNAFYRMLSGGVSIPDMMYPLIAAVATSPKPVTTKRKATKDG